ncbi:ATP-binding protein [Methylophilus medardicus]|uniref:histidine kinase n=1 Tax=Methylophilus medardicus TaxID=2588534 RepID=A0A5B8CUS5_9PROT|nr:ATP-binding protein [Methylophilus medardicus]QDC44655.1 HAMP domain-containing protein [Methylophilus medardicus]QDC49662.1 HAMP domain-containing protein [Methylophilus medardicus]QDC53367.1 HAMP domain-containing protein [Methylophilus medardicus]
MKSFSLQFKLNLIITLLLLGLLLTWAVSVIKNAREDVLAEVESTTNLVMHLLDAEIAHYMTDFAWLAHKQDGQINIFRLEELTNIRHLKVDFFDMRGQLRESNRSTRIVHTGEDPPKWFVSLLDISSVLNEPKRKHIALNGRAIGELVITPDPSFELREIWDDTSGLLAIVGLFGLSVLLFVYWTVRATFKPVKQIIHGLNQIERGEYQSRLPGFEQIELSEISDKFNSMASTLEQSIRNNHRLTQQIIHLQEEERKKLARDLHDEIGQYLTAVHVDASALVAAKKLSIARESAQAIAQITRQMMVTIQDILARLRPRVLDELGLSLALAELIHHWRDRNRGIMVVNAISNHLSPPDEAIAVTVYRILQECLTNISKHAAATRVTIEVNETPQGLYLMIADDGRGFDPRVQSRGYGLAGMQERVEGLMGAMQISSVPGQGTRIEVRFQTIQGFQEAAK